MDMKHKVTQFEQFMMTDPDEGNWWASLKKAKTHLSLQSFGDSKVYPAAVRKESELTGKPPKCIFIPSKKVLR